MQLFGTSGIRGVVDKDITPELCRAVGQAVGTLLPISSRVCIATDTRTSRDTVKSAVIAGLLTSGIEVTDLGILPTPALALLTRELGFATGIMVTASHNPPDFNGIKLFNANALGYDKAQEVDIERIWREKSFRSGLSGKLVRDQTAREGYFRFVKERFAGNGLAKGLRLVVDPGHGAAAGFASDLFTALGLNVIPLNDEPDGLFPGRQPEPREDTLRDTVAFLRQQDADLAICFDGDADRVVFCDRNGFLGFNEMITFISRLAVMATGKKKIATTVETGRLLDIALKDLEVEVVRGKVGDVNVAYLARELDAAIGVEGVGVYIMPEAGYYPDSIFAALTLLSYISDVREIRRFFDHLPELVFEKCKVYCPNGLKEDVMAEVERKAPLSGAAEVNALDGLRMEFQDSWMLIRASGTEPAIRVIAESPSSSRTKRLLSHGAQAVKSSLGGIAK